MAPHLQEQNAHKPYNFLSFALQEAKAFEFGDDLWTKSRRHTPYFFNAGAFRTGKTLNYLAEAFAGKLIKLYADQDWIDDGSLVLFGPAYKGIGLVHITAMALDKKWGASLVAVAYNRKEPKIHGEGGLFVGEPMKGKRVIIIEDVITDGVTKEEAVKMIRAEGGEVISCLIAFDRQERGAKDGMMTKHSGAQEFTEQTGVPIHAIATLADLITLMDVPNGPSTWLDTVAKMKAYRDQYGANL